MRHARYLPAKAFLDEAKKLRVMRGYHDLSILERLEEQRSLIPHLRLHYPDTVERRWFAESHAGMEVGGEREPDGPRWEAACVLENARDRVRWVIDPTEQPYALDDPEERFLQFIERPVGWPFVSWKEYRVDVSADGDDPHLHQQHRRHLLQQLANPAVRRGRRHGRAHLHEPRCGADISGSRGTAGGTAIGLGSAHLMPIPSLAVRRRYARRTASRSGAALRRTRRDSMPPSLRPSSPMMAAIGVVSLVNQARTRASSSGDQPCPLLGPRGLGGFAGVARSGGLIFVGSSVRRAAASTRASHPSRGISMTSPSGEQYVPWAPSNVSE